jgi:hypothetical protein
MLNNQERDQKMRVMRAEGMTLAEIGKEYGLSVDRIRRIVGQSRNQKTACIRRDRDPKMIAMRDEGKTLKEIASIFGVSFSLVCKIAGGKKRNMSKLFWSKYQVADNGCWEWTGAKSPEGYGRLGFEGKVSYAHRVAWILTHGPIPDGFMACHRCDNPSCINPDHLFLGDSGDNARDRENKHRNPKPVINSIGHPSKLTDHDVMTARRLYGRGAATISELSRCLHVSYGNMRTVVTGGSWKHLPIQVGA